MSIADLDLGDLPSLDALIAGNPPRKMTIVEMRAWTPERHGETAPSKRTSVSANSASIPSEVSANPARTIAPFNLRQSMAYTDGELDALVAELVDALSARGYRKAMRKPRRRPKQDGDDLFDRVRLHLRRLTLRVLNDRYRRGVEHPHRDLLCLALDAYLRRECSDLLYHHDYGEQRDPARLRRTYLDQSGMGSTATERVAVYAADYSLEKWRPTFIDDAKANGAKGGGAGKRKCTWTDADLDLLQTLDTLTVAQQAERMGTSPRRMNRMRRALRDRESGIER